MFYLAFMNRSGPGTICTTTTTSQSCVDESSRWPWLAIGRPCLPAESPPRCWCDGTHPVGACRRNARIAVDGSATGGAGTIATFVALCGQAGSLRPLEASTAKRGAGTSWSPPAPRNLDPHPLAELIVLPREACQAEAPELQVLKTDVRMASRSAS